VEALLFTILFRKELLKCEKQCLTKDRNGEFMDPLQNSSKADFETCLEKNYFGQNCSIFGLGKQSCDQCEGCIKELSMAIKNIPHKT